MEIIFDTKGKERIDLKGLSDAYRKLFLGTKEGKIVLDDLSQKSRICMPVFSNNSCELYFIEGMRNLFCYIASHLEERLEDNTPVTDYNPFQY